MSLIANVRILLVLPIVVWLILSSPLPMVLRLCGLVSATLLIVGVRRGGKTLLICSPLVVAVFSLEYFPDLKRHVGAFVIAYLFGLTAVGVFGYGRLAMSSWQFMLNTRTQLLAVRSDAAPSEGILQSESRSQRRTWAERLARRVLRVP